MRKRTRTGARLKTATILLLISAWACGRTVSVSEPLDPRVVDGVTVDRMNHIGRDDRLFGEWSAPRLGRGGKMFRTLQASGGGLEFELIKPEPVTVEVVLYEPARGLEVAVNDRVFPFSGTEFRRTIPAEGLRTGPNVLKLEFRSPARIGVEQIAVRPRRLSRLEQRFRPETDFLTPARLEYFFNPVRGTRLRLRLEFFQREALPVSVSAESEKAETSFSREVSPGRVLEIAPIDETLHRVRVDIPETRAGYVRLVESRLAVPTPRPKRIRSASTSRPNVLLILLDAARPDHFGCYGYERPTTPRLDAVAERSYRFNDVRCQSAYTLASTGTLLTGLAPDMHGVVSAFFNTLSEAIVTVPERFRKKGYFTAAVSSNPYFGSSFNFDRGFEKFVELFRSSGAVDAGAFVEPFSSLLEERGERPFFIYLHLREPHYPYKMPAPFFGRYQKRYPEPTEGYLEETKRIHRGEIEDERDFRFLTDVYDENLSYADHVAGQILDLLKERGLDERTIVAVTADHGEALGEGGRAGHNLVLQPQTVRIPLILSVPGFRFRPSVIDRPALTSDIPVTLCRLAGVEDPYPGLSEGRFLFSLPQRRVRICRSLNQTNDYPGYWVETFPYGLVVFHGVGRTDSRFFDVRQPWDKAAAVEGSPLAQEALIFFLQDLITRSARGVQAGGGPQLSREEEESLRSLGYIR